MERTALCLFLTAFIIPCTFEELCVDTSMKLIHGYNDKKITDTALWTTSLSLAMCLEKCYQDALCLSVNVAPDNDTCTGFKQKFEDRAPGTAEVQGYKVYETVKTLSLTCATNDHCSTYFGPAHCHDNLCRCDIGYSMDGFHCRVLTECTSFSDAISEYSGFVKWNNDFKSYTDQSLSSCGDHCLNSADCQTADFQVNTGGCWLDDNNWYGVDAGTRGSSSGFVYLQKECSW